MKNPKYQLPGETLLDYIAFKRAINQISEQLPLNPSSIIEIAQEELKNDKNGDMEGYHRYLAFLDLYRLLENHQSFFYPSDSDRSRIRQMTKGWGPMREILGDIPQAMSFGRDSLLENISWATQDTIRELLEYELIELDVTEAFWEAVQKAFNHHVYHTQWLEEQKDKIIPELGYDNIQEFMEDIANPDYDQPKVDREVREFIINHIMG